MFRMGEEGTLYILSILSIMLVFIKYRGWCIKLILTSIKKRATSPRLTRSNC